jgi:hypothetical protein
VEKGVDEWTRAQTDVRGMDAAGADRWERVRTHGTGSDLFVQKRKRARPSRPGTNGSWNAHNHYHTDAYQGADGWPSGAGENGRGLERAPTLCRRASYGRRGRNKTLID